MIEPEEFSYIFKMSTEDAMKELAARWTLDLGAAHFTGFNQGFDAGWLASSNGKPPRAM
jgi:hypothetical protein